MSIYNINGVKLRESEEKYAGLSEVYAGKKRLVQNGGSSNDQKHYPVFVHLSDIHGDSVRFKNAVEVANELDCTALINTGDTVRFYSTDDIPEMGTINVPYLITIGNHDSSSYTSENSVYSKFIAPYNDDNGYVLDTDVSYPTYYYVDFPTYNLRVFCLNDYQANLSTSITTTRLMYQTQLDWFCDKLLDTPSGYGIICCYHCPERGISAPSGYEDFQAFSYNTTVQTAISDIIDSYISGTTLSKTYFSSVTVSADFSTKNNNTEFIAHICGHNHVDHVGYYTGTTNRQLVLNIVCTCVWINKNQDGVDGTDYPYYNEPSDLARVEDTRTENAFNVYIIDRENKNVKIVRIGARLTTSFKDRKHMIIPYA